MNKAKISAIILIVLCIVGTLSFFILIPKPVSQTIQPLGHYTTTEYQRIYWGAWVGEEDRMPLSTIQTFESQVGKGMSIWNWIQWWTRPADGTTHDPNFDVAWMNECRNAGIIPMVSWSPDSIYQAGIWEGYNDILSGKWDSYLAAWGEASAAWGHPYFVRFMWEFNGAWTDQSITPWTFGMTPAMFVAMWQYVVNHVRAAGGTNISWIWCPAAIRDSVSTLESVYPGDQYVDWVGTDVYPPDVSSGFGSGVTTELNSIRAVAPNKPVMFCELGDSFSGTKTAWWTDTLTNTLPNEYPYVKAIVLWQEPLANLDVTSPPATLAAFQQGIATSHYSSNIYGSLNTSPIP